MTSPAVPPRVLVLGGRGFLGKHLVRLLVDSGVSVRVFTRTPSPEADFPPGVEVVAGDFVDGRGLAEALAGVALVYHLLSTTIASGSSNDPINDVTTNLTGTLRLLDLMKVAHVHRIVYASSGGTVYGNPGVLPVPESHPLRPICSYGIVKTAIESYLALHAKRDGLIVNVLRISNPYGEHQTRIGAQGVIATFIHRLMNQQPIEIWGDGSAVRDYIYAPDVARALMRAGQRAQSGIFNIGSGEGHSINEVLKIVQQQTGLTGTISYQPQRSFAVNQTYLDISRARRELGWLPSYTLEAGCARFVELLRGVDCRLAA